MNQTKKYSIPFKCNLRDNGLNNSNIDSVIKNTYQNALSYFLSTKRLVNKTDTFGNQKVDYMHIVEANIAFSIELFFKVILYKEKKEKIKGHNLLNLYKKLPQQIQDAIKNEVKIENDNVPFEIVLDEVSEVFEYERYYNEKIGSVVNMAFLFNLAIKLELYCRLNIINKTL